MEKDESEQLFWGGWAYRTVEWKMRERWMKRSEISLSASLNGQFHTCIQSKWLVGELPQGWRIKWFFRVTSDSETVLPIFTAECWHLLVMSVFKNKWTPMVMVLHFQFGPSCLHYDQHRASCSDCLTVLLKQVSSKQALINTNANIWNGLSVTYLYFLGLIFSNCCVTSPKLRMFFFYRHYFYTVMYFTLPSNCFNTWVTFFILSSVKRVEEYWTLRNVLRQ